MLPSILDGLADEAEGVRDAALAAGRTFVDLYAETALPLLLPAVEDGILNDNWRIRQSSVELLGQLLFKASPLSCVRESCATVHALYKTGIRLLFRARPFFLSVVHDCDATVHALVLERHQAAHYCNAYQCS